MTPSIANTSALDEYSCNWFIYNSERGLRDESGAKGTSAPQFPKQSQSNLHLRQPLLHQRFLRPFPAAFPPPSPKSTERKPSKVLAKGSQSSDFLEKFAVSGGKGRDPNERRVEKSPQRSLFSSVFSHCIYIYIHLVHEEKRTLSLFVAGNNFWSRTQAPLSWGTAEKLKSRAAVLISSFTYSFQVNLERRLCEK